MQYTAYGRSGLRDLLHWVVMKHALKKLSTSISVTVTVDEAGVYARQRFRFAPPGREVKKYRVSVGQSASSGCRKIWIKCARQWVRRLCSQRCPGGCDCPEDGRVLDQPNIEVTKLVPFTTLEFEAKIDVQRRSHSVIITQRQKRWLKG